MKKNELLVPVGDFECLKAAIQNGADAVYLGASEFNARNSATNFELDKLEEAIDYAHLRNVKVYLTLNTLIKNNEFNSALKLASSAYNFGIDAIIVQDLGLGCYLIKNFPDLHVHASTQMTCHNLDGAKFLDKLGFKRIVLSRELSVDEINYIKSNISCEIEVFVHGALCISYSGQCLYSSLIGGRSGNRGKCAQGCRLPYKLLKNNSVVDSGYLLSTRDLCSLDILNKLVDINVDSFKIEGRMKSPEYVATVTKIYRKYLDKILENSNNFTIEPEDKISLLQVFNRGGFSTGHLENSANHNLIYKEKPNHMGILLGTIYKYNKNNGHISLTLETPISIGDTISFEKENTSYRISELMKNDKNITISNIGDKVTLGRMKGNIHVGDKVYKLSSKSLSLDAKSSFTSENKKTALNAVLDLHLDELIKLKIFDNLGNEFEVLSDEMPDVAINYPISKEKLEEQLSKTNNTPFFFKNIKINMDNNLYVPHISKINELRRTALQKYEDFIIGKYKRNLNISLSENEYKNFMHNPNKVCLLLNNLNINFDYSKLKNVDKLYIPLELFMVNENKNILNILQKNFSLYIYMPTIIKSNFQNLFKNTIESIVKNYSVKGFVISNICCFELLKDYRKEYEFISNYTMNIFNNHTINELACDVITLSSELNKEELNDISFQTNKQTEFIVYGNIPLMYSSYCLLGKSNKCFPDCKQACKENNKYYLQDRMNFKFRIVPNNIQTITTIYNSKINSIDTHDLNVDYLRIDVLDETIDEINNIIDTVKCHNKLEGKNFTNGNINRIV